MCLIIGTSHVCVSLCMIIFYCWNESEKDTVNVRINRMKSAMQKNMIIIEALMCADIVLLLSSSLLPSWCAALIV